MSRAIALNCLVVAALCVAGVPVNAATWYCDPVNGSMAGDGSQGNPWGSLADVIAAGKIESQSPVSSPYAEGEPLKARNAGAPIQAGDTILLLTGDHGSIYLTAYYNAEMVTIEAAPGHTPVVQSWKAFGGMNWTFRGITFSCEPYGTVAGGTGLELEGHNWHGPMSDVLIEDCTFYSVSDGSSWSQADWGTYAGGGLGFNGKRATIRNNTVRYTTQGIGVAGEDILVSGNTIEHIGHDGIRCGGDRITLENNTMRYFYDIDENHDDGIQFYRSDGLPHVDAVIRGNVIDAWPTGHPFEATPSGIGCFDGPYVNWIVENNLVLGNQYHGITLANPTDCLVVNNTVIGFGIKLMDGSNSVARNNLSSGFQIEGTGHVDDHNIQVLETQRDAFFADVANKDFRLKDTSPAIDAGVSTDAPAVDIEGTARPQGAAIDVGAYEYYLVNRDITEIHADGWRATYPSPPTFDPAGDPKYVAVQRQGFDEAGQPTTVTDELLISSRVRLPWPDQYTLTDSDVSLSDFVFANDVVASVTNNSALQYPLPMGAWLHHDREVAAGGTFTARLAVAHAYARSGKPVAAVKFIAADGSNPDVEVLVDTMSVIEYPATGFSVPHFSADLDLSSLNEGMVTIDAVIYPWVGDAFTISVDGFAYPSPNLTVLKVLNDAGGYGCIYAYVDPVNGDNASGVAGTDESAAQASPYKTIAAAVSDAQSANNAAFGRNNTSGVIVKLQPGTHAGFGANSNPGEGDVPMLLTAADPAQRAATVLNSDGNVSNKLQTDLIVSNLTLKVNGADKLLYGLNTNMLVLNNCEFVMENCSSTSPLYYWGAIHFIGCEGYGLDMSPMTGGHLKLVLGSNIQCDPNPKVAYFNRVIGSRLVNFQGNELLAASSATKPRGRLLGWSHFGVNVSGYQAINLGDNLGVDANGLAIVGCVVERSGGAGAPMMVLAQGANTDYTVENIVVQQTTLVGARANVCYQDLITAETYKHCYLQHSVFYEMNHKCDTTGDNSFTGNWATRYKVGHKVNAFTQGDSRPAGYPGPDSWIGEILALGSAFGQTSAPLNVDWVDDQSGATQAGGGDYHPGDNTVIPTIPAGDAPYPVDMSGLAIADDGTALIGALQKLTDVGNRAPSANAGPNQTLADDDDNGSEDATLDGSGSYDPDGTIVSYEWTQNASPIATGASAVVTLAVGSHSIDLTVTDDEGATDTDSVIITVTAYANPAPTADAGPDQSVTDVDGDGSEDVTLDGSGSSDANGSIVSYVWEENASQIATGVSATVTLAMGGHTIDLTVTDDEGATDTDSMVATVKPLAVGEPILIDFGDDPDATGGDQTDWVIIAPDDINGGAPVDLGNGVTLTKSGTTDFTHRDIPFGSTLPNNFTYNEIPIPNMSVSHDFMKDSADPVKISGLLPGDYDVTIFESYNGTVYSRIWVGDLADKPATSNTGNISQVFVTIGVTLAAGDDLWVQICGDPNVSFGANGLIIEPLSVAPPAKPGDADGDNDVDLNDFVILKTNFGANPLLDDRADFDNDGDIDLNDFVILKTNFGT